MDGVKYVACYYSTRLSCDFNFMDNDYQLLMLSTIKNE